MFYYLEGTVAIIEHGLAVIDVNGAGYACFVTSRTLSKLEPGKRARLYTYCNIKEDAFDIFGFHDTSEKRCFEQLLSVSGVGPKAALSILSVCTPESLAMAVVNDDISLITQASGVGKKLAQRVVLELKDKVTRGAQDLAASGYVAPSGDAKTAQSEAVSALAILGFSQSEISQALRTLDTTELSTEQIIREVLVRASK